MFEFKDESCIQLFTAIFLTLSSFTGGYSAADIDFTQVQVEEVHTFDVFSYKAHEVDNLMEAALASPTRDNLRTMNNHLHLGLQNWANRHNGENKELFNDYLDACKLVIDEKQAGHDITDEKAEMDKLYNELRNE